MDIRLGKGVQKVTRIQRGDGGRRTATTIYKKKRGKKKGSPGISTAEKMVHGASESLRSFADSYTDRHDESNRKKQDGWFRDFPYNVYRAGGRAAKKFRFMIPGPIPLPLFGYSEDDEDDEDEED